MKHRVKIQQHILIPALVEHEVEVDAETGICEFVGDGTVVWHDEAVALRHLVRCTGNKNADQGANELAVKALLDTGVLTPEPGETIVVHGSPLPYDPECWTQILEPDLVPMPETPQVYERMVEWKGRRYRTSDLEDDDGCATPLGLALDWPAPCPDESSPASADAC